MEKNFLATTKISDTPNKSRKTGEIISHTYSTVIPKAVVNKFGLDKGRKLYWDINDNNIIITPELPEEDSITAGLDILQDMLINGNSKQYEPILKTVLGILKNGTSPEDKVKDLVSKYDTYKSSTNSDGNTDRFNKIVLYLLDYPLEIPDQYEILQEVYKQITKTD